MRLNNRRNQFEGHFISPKLAVHNDISLLAQEEAASLVNTAGLSPGSEQRLQCGGGRGQPAVSVRNVGHGSGSHLITFCLLCH